MADANHLNQVDYQALAEFRYQIRCFVRFSEQAAQGKLVGMVSLDDLLQARTRTLDAERRRERVLPLRLMFPFRKGKRSAS